MKQSFRWGAAIAALFFSIHLQAQPVSFNPNFYWKQTDLNFHRLTSLLDMNCNKSAKAVQVCLRLVNAFGSVVEPHVQIVNKNESSGKVLRDFGIARLVQVPDSVFPDHPKDLHSYYQKRRQRQLQQSHLARKIFDRSIKINFLQILRDQASHIPKGISLQYALAYAFNCAIHILDPHAQLVPTAEQDIRFKTADKRIEHEDKTENLETSLWHSAGQTILSLKIHTFSDERLCTDLRQKFQAAQKKTQLDGVILDLRDNGGGLVDQAVCVAGLFVGQKLIATIKEVQFGRLTGAQERKVSHQSQIVKVPMIVLVNGNSASASELVAGALQDYRRAWIVGEKTFGKGSVQTWHRVSSDPTLTLGVTTGRFYQPSGRTNQVVGIRPDFPGALKETKEYVPREKDLYLSALPAMNAPWKETRPLEVRRLQVCLKGSFATDTSLEYAARILRCQSQVTIAKAD